MTHPTPETLPEGYPRQLERVVTLDDGRAVFIRPVVPADAPLLAESVRNADPETLYYRFFTPSPRLDEEKIRYLTEVDYRHRLAVAAFGENGEPAGIARYEGKPGSDEAEFAVAIHPNWRRVGLARHLFDVLEEAAARNGIGRFTAVYLAENEAADAMLRAFGFGHPLHDRGVVTVSKDLAAG